MKEVQYMKFRRIDEALFSAVTQEDRKKNNTMAYYAARRLRLLHTAEDVREAAGLLEKTVSESVTFEYNGKIVNDSKTIAGDFPPAYYPETFSKPKEYGRKTEYIPLDHFYQMQALYKQNKSDLSKLPWEFGNVLRNLRRAVNSVAPTFFGRFGSAFKWLGFTLVSAAVAVLSFLGDQYDWFDFFTPLILLMAGVFIVACLATLGGLLMTLMELTTGPSKEARQEAQQKLAHQYKAAVKFVRLRMLWCKEATGKDAVPEYLMAAQKEIEKTVRRGRKHLKKQLGSEWDLPKEDILRAEELRLGPAPVPPAAPAKAPKEDEEAAWALAFEAEVAEAQGDIERAGQLYYEACRLYPKEAAHHISRYTLNAGPDWMLAEKMCELIPEKERRKYMLESVYVGAVSYYWKHIFPDGIESNDDLYEHFCQPDIQAVLEELMYFLRKRFDNGFEDLKMAVICQIFAVHTLDDAREACRWLKLWLDAGQNESDRNSMMWLFNRRFREVTKEYDECGLKECGNQLWKMLIDCGDARSMFWLATRYFGQGYYTSAKEWAKKAMAAGYDKMKCETVIAMAERDLKKGR